MHSTSSSGGTFWYSKCDSSYGNHQMENVLHIFCSQAQTDTNLLISYTQLKLIYFLGGNSRCVLMKNEGM